ncbi:glycoside hydrolase family 2 TIM barrel-domain containing protein [Pelagicoccus enzymogenes]|uniref:glycoside hydrolase family 2 TIM barrel-domain containing protein n=1 Tax=Pelagicoccus enzymogenes TaxID=2773457 RepID=UPI00280D89A1|nr:glycoside hydrolase family 2 TIM barrel-domain containing protein [Pelagicoccus enzymogenes]MDQ8201202.1 glycoside hydrolase family 2 TIM barrel-domain containing protein [Pelagicoccus enzymogenes]
MIKPQSNHLRQTQLLDGFWTFRRDADRIGEEQNWNLGFAGECELAVPGSWNEQRSELEQYFGIAWYSKSFIAHQSWQEHGVSVHFGSVQNHAKVWLNGTLVGTHEGGTLPFQCDLSASLVPGQENLLVVQVDASINPWDLPPARIQANAKNEGFHNSNPSVTYDFFPFGGIPRPVTLQITPEWERIDKIRVETALDREANHAKVSLTVSIKNSTATSVLLRIENDSASAAVDASGIARVNIEISSPRIWDIGSPELYLAEVSLQKDGKTIDHYSQSFGLRTIEVVGNSLRLNGRDVFLRGYGKHEDFPVLGRGLSLPLVARDFDLLAWTGANSFRTSHYPYAEEWYEFADRHGILIIAETPMVGLCERLFASEEIKGKALKLVSDMVERDHHHPSVIMWSVANEPWIESQKGTDFITALLAEARSQDSSRPVTYVAHNGIEINAACHDCDIVSVNRYGGWYDYPGDIETGTQYLGKVLDKFHSTFGKPILLAEFGADAIPGEHSLPAIMFTEEYQADIIEAQIAAAESREWVIGTHVWAFSDFKTGQSITRAVRNHKGIFTRERLPKMAAHRIRQIWTNK